MGAKLLELQTTTNDIISSREHFHDKIIKIEKSNPNRASHNFEDSYSTVLMQLNNVSKDLHNQRRLNLNLKKDNKDFQYNVQFTQFTYGQEAKLLADDLNIYFAEVVMNRGLRLFLVIFTVFILTGLCIFGVKLSIDYVIEYIYKFLYTLYNLYIYLGDVT